MGALMFSISHLYQNYWVNSSHSHYRNTYYIQIVLHFCYRLADLMDQHKEELATIESIDSGAVYTLAIKTHVGMSIDTFRYFAGWCDKIQVR